MTTKKDHLRKKSTEPEAIAPGAEAAPEPTIEVPSAAMAETEAVEAAEAEEVAEEVAQSGDEDEEEDESEEEAGDEDEESDEEEADDEDEESDEEEAGDEDEESDEEEADDEDEDESEEEAEDEDESEEEADEDDEDEDESEEEADAEDEDEDEDEEEADDEDEDESGEESGDESETEIEAEDGPEPEGDAKAEDEDEPEFNPKPRPPAKLERLQKILAAAGVASRRSAEAMIEQGRVQVNGAVVTELGTKADAGRDHIRVDGKLLQGAERLRYFVLNKPKGFVTTVKDPEGRPTVMQFFDKMRERLYPVGRLDYMSEGLLLVTNDGDLANRLTKASSGVEKTYLVKVAGQPTEDELDILRGGVSIERGKPGEGRVRTSPARIRQVRQGDNPWYEVILIEGRNRELRKMFEEVGHFVEKIRRVGYGPLVLDQEPGNLRELEPGEVEALRKVAEGKLRTPKSKELRRRNLVDAGKLPTVLPKPSRLRPPVKPFTSGPGAERSAPPNFGPDYRPKRAFGTDRPDRPARPASDRGPARPDDRPRRDSGPSRFGSAGSSSRPSARPYPSPDARAASRPAWKKDDRPARPAAPFTPGGSGEDRPRPAWKKDDRPARPAAPFTPGGGGEDRPRPSFPRAGGAGAGRTGGGRTFGAKPAWNKSGSSDRPAFKRPDAPRREAPIHDEDSEPVRPPNLHIEELPQSDRSNFSRPSSSRPPSGRPGAPRFSSDRPSAPRYSSDRPGADRPRPERPPSDRPSGGKPFRSESGLARPFTTSSGKPRAGGARPSSKPGKPGGSRPYGAGTGARSSSGPRAGSDSRPSYGSGSGGKRPYESRSTGRPSAGSGSRSDGPARPYTPRTEPTSDYRPTEARPYPPSSSRAERKAGPGWKPKSNFGGAGKSPSGARSGPRPGGPSKSGYKPSGPRSGGARPGGPRPGGPRSGGPRPGGASGGKRRG